MLKIILLFIVSTSIICSDEPASAAVSQEITIHIDQSPRLTESQEEDRRSRCPRYLKIALITSGASILSAGITAAITFNINRCPDQ